MEGRGAGGEEGMREEEIEKRKRQEGEGKWNILSDKKYLQEGYAKDNIPDIAQTNLGAGERGGGGGGDSSCFSISEQSVFTVCRLATQTMFCG